MLRALRIKNLALVEDLRWELGPGLNVLTGETGAGKSLLLGGLGLLLGDRADKTLLRTGADQCSVEAELQLAEGANVSEIQLRLESMGAEPCEHGALLLKRSFSATGSGKQYVNGSPVTLSGLKHLGDLLVDVHGPHDHQSLLAAETQRELLDAYAQGHVLRQRVAVAWQTWQEARQARFEMNERWREREESLARLERQVAEIEQARLTPGEDEIVERDYKVATHARQILEWAQAIIAQVAEAEPSVFQQLATVERTLAAWERLDAGASPLAEINRSAIAQLQELSSAVQDAAEKIDLDAGRLQQLEARLNLLQSLRRKYGGTLADVIEQGRAARVQLDTMQSAEGSLAALEAKEAATQADYLAAAAALSTARTKAATPLGKKVSDELRLLGFAKARFRISVTAGEPSRHGADAVEYFFAPNVGEEDKPLRSIASSGEMARVMLAVKTTLAAVDAMPILVFDEVDANVGGETAVQVGKKLAQLGSTHQVLCVTHLPQVAAAAHRHFAVRKDTKAGRTTTGVEHLSGEARVAELARMLGGQSEQAKALAVALLGEAKAKL